jgi:hypothetical protein
MYDVIGATADGKRACSTMVGTAGAGAKASTTVVACGAAYVTAGAALAYAGAALAYVTAGAGATVSTTGAGLTYS